MMVVADAALVEGGGCPAGSMRRSRPAAVIAPRMPYTAWGDVPGSWHPEGGLEQVVGVGVRVRVDGGEDGEAGPAVTRSPAARRSASASSWCVAVPIRRP